MPRRGVARLGLPLATLLALTATDVHAQREGPTLLFGGDVIFDDPVDYALRQMDRSRDDASAYAPLFEELELGAADLTVVNLETPVAPRTRSREDGFDVPLFAAPRAFLEALANAGVDGVTVANNHAYDQGVRGLETTLASARELGVVAIGAGSSRTEAFEGHTFEVAGHRVAIVSATEGVNVPAERAEGSTPRVALLEGPRLDAAVARARAQSELTVVVLHWTNADQNDALPTEDMRAWCARAAAAGADLVIGHGPHVPGPRERVQTPDGREVTVLYSLGNLVAVMQAEHDELEADRVSVRDAVLASVRTRVGTDGRLAIASVGARAFFIGPSSRRSFGEGRTRFVRPLSVDAELARETRAACGRSCDERAAAYASRRARIASLFGEVLETPRRAAPTPTLTAAPTAALAAAPIPTPTPALGPAPIPLPTLSPTLVDLGLVFAPHSARELAHDPARVTALAARLLAEPRLRVAITAHPGPEESEALASRRAHHARGLLSVLGPSRSRFDLRVGDPDPSARIEIRVTAD